MITPSTWLAARALPEAAPRVKRATKTKEVQRATVGIPRAIAVRNPRPVRPAARGRAEAVRTAAVAQATGARADMAARAAVALVAAEGAEAVARLGLLARAALAAAVE